MYLGTFHTKSLLPIPLVNFVFPVIHQGSIFKECVAQIDPKGASAWHKEKQNNLRHSGLSYCGFTLSLLHLTLVYLNWLVFGQRRGPRGSEFLTFLEVFGPLTQTPTPTNKDVQKKRGKGLERLYRPAA